MARLGELLRRAVGGRAVLLAAATLALLGPPALAVTRVYVSAVATDVPTGALAVLATVALLAGLGILAARRRWRLGALALAECVGLLAFLGTWCGAPLPAPPPLALAALPPATPPATMQLWQLPTGVIHRTAAFAYRGGAVDDHRDFAMTALLVRHPRGDLLIDAGLGRQVRAHLADLPWAFRAVTNEAPGTPVVDQLTRAGIAPAQLAGILLTHGHWDHASGAADLGDAPIWVTEAERAAIVGGDWLTAAARRSAARLRTYGFEGGPYLGFPVSHDVFGDGSVVVVPCPGHTPGSVVVFVALPSGRRYALVGDLVWQREGITQRQERPWLMRTMADADAAAVRRGIGRLAAIAARFPEIELVPAHDARGLAAVPTL